jgi:hypothetical protein
MSTILLIIIASAGVNSLLMPPSPIGVTTGFASARDAEAIFYNPAHFEARDNFKLSCFYNRFYVSMQSVSLSLSKKIKSIDIGLGIVNFDYGDIEWRPDYPTEDSLTSYSAHDLAVIVGGSARIAPQGKVGIAVKYIYENIYAYADYTFAFDISFSYGNPIYGVSLGAANVGSGITLNNESVNLPTRLSLGGYYGLKMIRASVDVHYLVNTSTFDYGVGVTVPLYSFMTIHAALNYREDFYPGFGLSLNHERFEVKYGGSFYPHQLGMVNTIGIGLNF